LEWKTAAIPPLCRRSMNSATKSNFILISDASLRLIRCVFVSCGIDLTRLLVQLVIGPEAFDLNFAQRAEVHLGPASYSMASPLCLVNYAKWQPELGNYFHFG